MLPGMELMSCPDLAVPRDVMHHVVRVESSYNPYAIGVVGGRLVRQPRNLAEAVSTARMLEQRGYNFSLGLAQVNRYNLAKYGLTSYEHAFQACANLVAGSRILRECYGRSGNDWGKSFSCYYSGDFKTGFRHGYVQKVFASMRRGGGAPTGASAAIAVVDRSDKRRAANPDESPGWQAPDEVAGLVQRRSGPATPGAGPYGAATAPAVPEALAVGAPSAGTTSAAPGMSALASARTSFPAPPAQTVAGPPVVVAASRLGAPNVAAQAVRPAPGGSDGAFVF